MNIGNNEEIGNSQSNTINHERYIEVPHGWNRCLENGNIVYFSPSLVCLRSKEDIARYLISDTTCKCGLDCPFYIDKVFNFDASIPSRHFKITKLENDHKTKCKETIKARFATQSQTANKKGTKDVNSKPVVIKKKSEASAPKKKNETPKLPSFETFASLPDGKPSQNLSEQTKAKKSGKAAAHKRKPNINATLTSAVPISILPAEIRTCQTVHSNNSASKDGLPQTSQYPIVSTAAVFGTSEHHRHSLNQNVGSLLTHLNASSFLATLSSSAPTVPGRPSSSRTNEVGNAQKNQPVHINKSSVEHTPFGQKSTAFPAATSQPNNLVYISSGLHPMPNQNSKVNWQGAAAIPLPRLPQGKGSIDKTSVEKSIAGLAMKGKEALPKILYPYPAHIANTKSTISASSTSPVKVPLKQQDLQTVLPKQQTTVKTTVAGRHEAVLSSPGHSSISNTDKPSTRTASSGGKKLGETVNQPLQYCGIILQPGMVPQVQLAGTGASVGAASNQSIDQSQYGNLYTVQGIPYSSNVGAVGNPAMLGMTPNTVIPYFLGITQPGTIPKPIVPSTTSTSTTKESSPTCSASTTPVSTSAIAAAYSAFVSIAPASVTNCSFSQQLVNLVSNYNNPYWQHLLTQGASSNTLAYQLMQISQYASTARQGLTTQTTKSSSTKNTGSSHSQTKSTTSSSKSSGFNSPERKPKTVTKDSSSVPPASCAVTRTTVTTVSKGDGTNTTDCVTSKSCVSNAVVESACTSSEIDASNADNLKENTSDQHENNVGNVISAVTQSSSEEILKNEDSTVSPHYVSNSTIQEFTEESTISMSDKVNLISSTINEGSKTEQESDQKNETGTLESQNNQKEDETCIAEDKNNEREKVCTLEGQNNMQADETCTVEDQNTVKSEHNPPKSECEKLKTENTNNDCTNVTSDSLCVEDILVNHKSEKIDKESNNVISEQDKECFDKGNDNVVTEADRESSCVVKADSLDDTVQQETPMDTEDVKNSVSNNQNCDEDLKVNNEEIAMPVDSDVQNGVAERISNDTGSTEVAKSEEISECAGPVEFTIGDVVWAQARGLPSWPGKIVDEPDVGSGRADNGKKWVMWFGDHTFSQVEVEKLKTLTEGLKTLDDKGRKRKYRGKKTRIGLEQAIGEALEELDQRERLRSRQGPKAKKRRL